MCHISEPALVAYLKQSQEGGIELLKKRGFGGSEPIGQTCSDAGDRFQGTSAAHGSGGTTSHPGTDRHPNQIPAFPKRLGMKCRKVGDVPGRAAHPDKQAEQEVFKTQEFEPRLAEAKAGLRRGLFMDAAHFVLGAYLSMVWGFTRLLFASPSGHQRFYVPGAVGAVTKESLTVTSRTCINAESVCLLLTQIAARYVREKITIVLDNARDQK